MISRWTKGLRARLLLIGFAPVVLIAIICATLFNLSSDLQKKIDFAYTVRTKSVEQMGAMDAATQEIGRRMWSACLLLGNAEQIKKRIDQTQDALNVFDEMEQAYLKLPTDPESKKIFDAVEQAWPKIKTGVTELFPLLQKSTPADMDKVKAEVERVVSTLRVSSDAFDKLTDISHKTIDSEKAEVQAHAKSQERMAAIISVGGLLMLLVYVIVFASRLSKNLSSIVHELESSGEAVNTAAEQVHGNSEELSQSTTEQAAAIQQTSASVEEINSMILQTSENAKKSTIYVEEEEQVVRQGQTYVQQMVQSINEIDESSELLAQEMQRNCQEFQRIVTLIGEIENKTKVINDIVFQTKLLSFNASVEAARAGESGKGFAVVAEEVGNLAQMSGRAAKEISSLLEGSVRQVEDIVANTNTRVQDLVQASKIKVESGTKVAASCETVFLDIVTKAADVSSRIKEISSASQEQSKGVQEITSAIQQLDATTQKNSSMSRDTAEAAGTLTRQSDVLSKVVKQLTTTVNGRMVS